MVVSFTFKACNDGGALFLTPKGDPMANRIVVTLCCFFLSVVAISCTSLKSRHIVGETIPMTEEEISTETVWKFGDDVYRLRLVDANHLVAATMEWDENKGMYTVRSYPVVPSKLGDHMFLNVKEGAYYIILRLVASGDDTVVLLTADEDKLEKDIAEGTLKARKENHEFIMDGSKEVLDQYIGANIDTLFSLEAAGVAQLILGEMK